MHGVTMEKVHYTLDMKQFTLYSMSTRLACFILFRQKYQVDKQNYTSFFFYAYLVLEFLYLRQNNKSFSLMKTLRIRAGKLT